MSLTSIGKQSILSNERTALSLVTVGWALAFVRSVTVDCAT